MNITERYAELNLRHFALIASLERFKAESKALDEAITRAYPIGALIEFKHSRGTILAGVITKARLGSIGVINIASGKCRRLEISNGNLPMVVVPPAGEARS